MYIIYSGLLGSLINFPILRKNHKKNPPRLKASAGNVFRDYDSNVDTQIQSLRSYH